MRKTCKFLLAVWCCCGSTTTLAFLSSIVARRRRLSPSCVFGTIGNEDFASIFGSQEAAERKTRDLAREYHRRPNANATDSGGDKDKDKDESHNNKHEKAATNGKRSKKDEDLKETVARKTELTSRVVGKYVPPPGLWKK